MVSLEYCYTGGFGYKDVKKIADGIIATGVKTADAYHVACAILADSDYFLTTDDRLLKYKTDKLQIMDPTEFIREWEVFLQI